MIGLEQYCRHFLDLQLSDRDSRLARKITSAVLTGHCRALTSHCGLLLGQATMLWASRLALKRLPLLVLPDANLRQASLNVIRHELVREKDVPLVRVDAVRDDQIRTPADGLGGSRQISEDLVVSPDFVIFDGFGPDAADLLVRMQTEWGVRSAVLLGGAELVTAIAGRGRCILG